MEEARSRVDSDADEAVVLLGAALAEWNGDPFADFAYEAFARNDIARLEELRLEALELRFDAQLSRGQTTELVAALQTFVRENPYRERPVGQLMVALYRAGRQAEALRAFERHRRVLGEELGVDPSPELRLLEEQILLHDQRLKPRTSEPRFRLSEGQIHVNPYQGLHAFRESDQGQFFGREPLVAELLRRLGRGGRLVALVGPSGSGKSSVVHAGLIPKVRKEALEGEWLVATMVPGAHPFTELEAALLRSRLDAPDSLSDQLATGDQAILRAGLRVLPDDGARLLIVIDQFEELFTLVEDREEERRFLDALLVAVDDPHGRVRVVLTLRADFYDRPLLHPRFGSRLGDAVVNVTPLDAQELEEAAVHPAAATGVRIEPTLLARLLADVVDQPGALPMFQYTLTDLYEQRDGDVMVESAYNEMGGVRGAITHRAEELFLDIGPEEQAAARQLFLRLVAMSDGETWSRRRVKASEIISLDVDVVALQAVLDRFGTHRLLLFDRDRVSGSPTVEVGHEALLSEWDRLEDWINDARQDLVRHRSFAASVDEWERSGRDPDYLVSGSRLAEYERWASGSAIELNARELDYLGASLDRRTAEVAAAEEQAAREAALEGSAKRRLWGLAAAVAVLVGLAAAVAFTAFGSDPPRVALVDANAGLTKQGLDEAARRFDIEAVSVTPPWVSPEAVGEELAESGTELIVMTGFDADVAEDLALRFPDTTFVVPFDPFDSDAPNYVRYRFAHEEGGYLAGIAAASTSATGVIGFIGAFELTETYHSLAGFQSGAWSVNPDLRIEVRFAFGPPSPSNFERPAVGYEVAREMFARGVDVIYHHAENTGLGIFRAARDASEGDGALRRWGIGSFSDQYVQLDPADRDYLLMSVVRRLDTVVLDATERLLTGQLTEPEVTLTMADEGFGYLDSGGKLPAALVDTLSRRRDGFDHRRRHRRPVRTLGCAADQRPRTRSRRRTFRARRRGQPADDRIEPFLGGSPRPLGWRDDRLRRRADRRGRQPAGPPGSTRGGVLTRDPGGRGDRAARHGHVRLRRDAGTRSTLLVHPPLAAQHHRPRRLGRQPGREHRRRHQRGRLPPDLRGGARPCRVPRAHRRVVLRPRQGRDPATWPGRRLDRRLPRPAAGGEDRRGALGRRAGLPDPPRTERALGRDGPRHDRDADRRHLCRDVRTLVRRSREPDRRGLGGGPADAAGPAGHRSLSSRDGRWRRAEADLGGLALHRRVRGRVP